MSQEWMPVCSLADITPDSGVCALINDQQVAIFRIGMTSKVFALSNYDPFSKANVLSRGLVCDIEGKVTVASPIYKQHFVLDTGQCLEDESVKLDTFSVRVENNQVEIAA